MQRVHIDYCNATIAIMLRAAQSLWSLNVSDAVQRSQAYGKGDTFRLDAVPEISLRTGYSQYDKNVVFVTEETGAHSNQLFTMSDNRRKFPMVDISDPFDRSVPTQEFLTQHADSNKTIWDLFSEADAVANWEKQLGEPASITGGCSAVTKVYQGIPIFSVIVNFVTRQLIVACSAGVYCLGLPEDLNKVDLTYARDNGSRIYFPDINHHGNACRFVTFMGKNGYKGEYRDNFEDSQLVTDKERQSNLHFGMPGGPLRPLYLSTLHPDKNRPGFILSNGEKLGEWVHWLTFLRFGRKPQDDGDLALNMHEIFGNRSNIRDGVLMSPTPPYSLFRNLNQGEGNSNPNNYILDVGMFPRFAIPSRIRSTLVLAPSDNQWIQDRVTYMGYRPILIHPE